MPDVDIARRVIPLAPCGADSRRELYSRPALHRQKVLLSESSVTNPTMTRFKTHSVSRPERTSGNHWHSSSTENDPRHLRRTRMVIALDRGPRSRPGALKPATFPVAPRRAVPFGWREPDSMTRYRRAGFIDAIEETMPVWRVFCDRPRCRIELCFLSPWSHSQDRETLWAVGLPAGLVEKTPCHWMLGTHAKRSRRNAPRRPRYTGTPASQRAPGYVQDGEFYVRIPSKKQFAPLNMKHDDEGRVISALQRISLRPEMPLTITCLQCGTVNVVRVEDVAARYTRSQFDQNSETRV